jgi:hypothetical protein
MIGTSAELRKTKNIVNIQGWLVQADAIIINQSDQTLR